MAITKDISAQRDFSAGELDVSHKRGDDAPEMRAGARQALNWRILNSRALDNRPGRSIQFVESGRSDEVTMSPGNTFRLCFGNGTLKVRDSAGAVVSSTAGVPWTPATVKNIVWDVYQSTIYIMFPGMAPRTLTWDGAAAWTAGTFTPTTLGTGQKRVPFYRIAPRGITMLPSGVSGTINITFSAAVLAAGAVGARFRYHEKQMTIATVTGPTTGTATVNEILKNTMRLAMSANPQNAFAVGEAVIGSVSGARGIVVQVGNPNMDVQVDSGIFVAPETIVGPNGIGITAGVSSISPVASPVWDEEVWNAWRGYPQSCFVDQNRLGFTNFPAVPGGISWSTVGIPEDMYVGAAAIDGFFELAPGKSQVLFVAPGAESNEFVFCDNAIYYIPISVTNPLRPGSVAFNLISNDGSAAVQPRRIKESLIYVNAGTSRPMAVVATGTYSRPFETRDLADKHAHLFGMPVAIAVPSADSSFPERYAYVLNADGTLAVGKYLIDNGNIKGLIGWVPWNCAGTVGWVSAHGENVLFTTVYIANAVDISIVEALDDTQYLDAAIPVNAVPPALTPAPGLGPLWWFPDGTVDLMDGVNMLGTHEIDADGNIVPIGGEDLSSLTLMAGQTWTATLEPFVPAEQPGQDRAQRIFRRRIGRVEVYVQNSTGFRFDTLNAEQNGPNLPAPGTVRQSRRIPAWNQDDNQAVAPPIRERAYAFKPTGRAHDPRCAIVKDLPGPLTIVEVAMRVTV